MVQINLSTKHKQTHRHRAQTCGCPGREGGREVDWEFGVGWCKLLGEGNGTPLQYFCLENPMDRGPW